jgi:hypothetical protein
MGVKIIDIPHEFDEFDEFDEFEGVTWSATKLVFANEDILRQNIRYL